MQHRDSYLVVSPKGSLELCDDSLEQQQPHFRHFGVDNSHERGIDMREVGTGHLRFHDGANQQTATTNDVLMKELWNDVGDVDRIHLIRR